LILIGNLLCVSGIVVSHDKMTCNRARVDPEAFPAHDGSNR
jgi:hypothetical protein